MFNADRTKCVNATCELDTCQKDECEQLDAECDPSANCVADEKCRKSGDKLFCNKCQDEYGLSKGACVSCSDKRQYCSSCNFEHKIGGQCEEDFKCHKCPEKTMIDGTEVELLQLEQNGDLYCTTCDPAHGLEKTSDGKCKCKKSSFIYYESTDPTTPSKCAESVYTCTDKTEKDFKVSLYQEYKFNPFDKEKTRDCKDSQVSCAGTAPK